MNKTYANVREMFSNPSSQISPSSISISISDVSWSICQTQDVDDGADRLASPDLTTRDAKMKGEGMQDFVHVTKNDPFELFSMPGDLNMADDSLVAAAGSNGVVLVWRACDLLRGLSDTRNNHDIFKQYYGQNQSGRMLSDSSSSIGYPEAVLVEHSKAVKVAWHPSVKGLLLTASLDGTAKLWERTADIDPDIDKKDPGSKTWSWLSHLSTSQYDNTEAQSYSWKCKQVFKPNCGAIRDVKWNTFNDDLFAMVTNDGFLVVYHTVVPHRPTVRIAAHAREATTVDWHPTRPYVIATGGVDRMVKVWDLEADLNLSNMGKSIGNQQFNGLSHPSTYSNDSNSSSNDATCPKTSGGEGLDHSYHGLMLSGQGDSSLLSRSTHGFTISGTGSLGSGMIRLQSAGAHSSMSSGRTAKNISKHIHELSVSAQVEKLQWRPPKRPISSFDRKRYLDASSSFPPDSPDHHEAMLAVATTVSGATSGGSGKVHLWSCHRPFMPLSIVDGHKEKSVADFIWLDTPDIVSIPRRQSTTSLTLKGKNILMQRPISSEQDDPSSSLSGTWQHVLTVGRDGKCLVQSFCRGERPISTVPPSAFAIAEMSPFQKGFGSLQLIAAHQNVPSGRKNDYALCGLRRDRMTAKAPGIFKEPCAPEDDGGESAFEWNPRQGGLREQSTNLDLTFSTTDSGDLKDLGKKAITDEVTIAPEVVHMSRFADSYKLQRDAKSRTKAAVCRHNSNVAEDLNCMALARMWNILASLLEGSGSEELSGANAKKGFPKNALSFALLPTLKTLLLERADAGDIQTCVVICEVMEVIPKKATPTNTRNASAPEPSLSLSVPGLDVMLVRQWYLSYIELLQQMCLFSHATNLIRICRDPEIAKLNQQSTT